MVRSFLILYLFVSLIFNPAFKSYADLDNKKFEELNPDGKKYPFVRDYLTSLSYLKLNAERNNQNDSSEGIKLSQRINSLLDGIVKDNLNLRIARNYLKRYNTAENGLILKVVQLFVKVCDEQINFNNQEKIFLQKFSAGQNKKEPADYDFNKFYKDQNTLGNQRKESLKQLLEASLLVNKALISNKPDKFGEFVMLGITKEEREKLLNKLILLFGDQSQGGVKAGQTFLQASVEAIREILKDKTWLSLDG